MAQSRDPRTGKFAPGGGASDQPRGGRGWKTAGAKPTGGKRKKGGKRRSKGGKKKAEGTGRRLDRSTDRLAKKALKKVIRKVAKKVDEVEKKDPIL